MDGISDQSSIYNLAYKGDLKMLQARVEEKERYVSEIFFLYIFHYQ